MKKSIVIITAILCFFSLLVSTSTSHASQQATHISVQLSTNSAVAAQKIVITAWIIPAQATGQVTFKMNGFTLGTASLSNGKATLTNAMIHKSSGALAITAEYAGNGAYKASKSDPNWLNVGQAPTTTVLISSQNPSLQGQQLIITARIYPPANSTFGPGDGVVTFWEGSTKLATVGVTNWNITYGEAKYFVPANGLPWGMHKIWAMYQGGFDFTGSISPTLSQQIYLFS